MELGAHEQVPSLDIQPPQEESRHSVSWPLSAMAPKIAWMLSGIGRAPKDPCCVPSGSRRYVVIGGLASMAGNVESIPRAY